MIELRDLIRMPGKRVVLYLRAGHVMPGEVLENLTASGQYVDGVAKLRDYQGNLIFVPVVNVVAWEVEQQ